MGLTLLRHAPLSLKYQKTFIGHTDVDIDKNQVIFSKLEKIKNKNFDMVFSSDLKRCTQTLDLLQFNYTVDSRLREVAFKDEFECKRFNDVEQMDCFRQEYLNSMKSWHNFICKESFEDFNARTKSFIDELPKQKNILICTHGGTIKMIYSILKKIDYEDTLIKVNYLDTINI